MAGIYIHIPFCGHACTYCDFYFTTTLNYKERFLTSLMKEIDFRKGFLKNQNVSTIYFGGGTPSQLSANEISGILEKVHNVFHVDSNPEITLECNPDDLSDEKAQQLKLAGINRISMGVQSFHDEELKLLGRRHSGTEAVRAVESMQKAGFTNYNLDLIYGIPNSTLDSWKQNLDTILGLEPNHISSYCLTIEPGTPLAYQVKKKRVLYPSESTIVGQFELLTNSLSEGEYDHYEISNFSLDGFESKHNTSYWKGAHYLGLGPSAHSFDGERRIINIANTKSYCELIGSEEIYESETLSNQDRFNEYLMTGLRTKWGVDMIQIQNDYPSKFLHELQNGIIRPISQGLLEIKDNRLLITPTGKLFADKIASDLFIVD